MLIRRSPRYIELSAKALVPTLVSNGVAFEAHAQNLLVRVNKYTGKLLGFVIRDLGGLRIHPATLRQSTGVNFQFLPEHVVAAKTLEEVYPKFYHTYVHNHISRLVRLLGLHANGIGWDILRKHMSTVVPNAHPLWKLWMSPESRLVESKCLMRMRMQDSYRNVSPANCCCIVRLILLTLLCRTSTIPIPTCSNSAPKPSLEGGTHLCSNHFIGTINEYLTYRCTVFSIHTLRCTT